MEKAPESERVLVRELSLDAAGVDQLMGELARARFHMSPSVSNDGHAAMECAMWQEDPSALVSVGLDSEDKWVAIALRHEGFGWMCFRLTRENAAAIGIQLHKASGKGLEANALLVGTSGTPQ